MSTIQVKRIVSASAPNSEGPQGLVRGLRCRDRLADFAQDAAGDVAILFGLMATALFMLMGGAVDLGRWLNARDHTLMAIDAAVLAGGRTLQTNGGNQADAIAMAKRYYDEAIKTRIPVQNDTVVFTVVDGGKSVLATGSAEIKTPFMGFGGIVKLPLFKADGTESQKATLANAQQNVEIAMMLDTSGSMSGDKLGDMKDAAKDLVDIVVWADQSKYKSRIAIVPFSGDVRVPAAWKTAVTDPAWPATRTNPAGSSKPAYKKTVCVAERTGTNKSTDVVAGPGNYVMHTYTSDGDCSQDSADNTVVPMSSDKVMLKQKITNLDLGGGTAGHIGTAWAYYMLSPNWANIVGSTSAAVAYNTPKTLKVAILMTDGEYNYTFDSQGRPTDKSGSNANGTSSAGQALAICTQMKGNNNNIQVYTVGFDLGGNTTAINTLKNCASDLSKFYNAANAEQLKAAFRDIALKVSTLHLTQ
jgi:Flp pilus assembly protein TadG